MAVVRLINQKKAQYYKNKFSEADCKETFRMVSGLISSTSQRALPSGSDHQALAQSFVTFFHVKVEKIHISIAAMTVDTAEVHPEQVTVAELTSFQPQTPESIRKVIKNCAPKSCSLDPLPTALLKDDSVLPLVAPYITHIINKSLESGIVPDDFKVAQVVPLLKKEGLDKNIFSNYRPVSNLPFLSKVLEKVVAQQLTKYLQQHQLYDPLQSAYKKGHSTETALLKIKADVDNIMDDGDGVLLVMLDLSAAFDTLDHGILLNRLEHTVGLKGSALSWMRSYLSNRHQQVHIDNAVSQKVQLSTGVPQGSVLGPLLFLLYILPLKSIIEAYNISRHGYADDSQLYNRLQLKDPLLVDQAVMEMEKCLVAVRCWMLCNKLKLNDSKTEVMIVMRNDQRKKVKNIRLKIGESFIVPSKCVRNLGGVLDDELSMENQVKSVVRSANFHIRRISKIRSFLDNDTCAKVINATITSRLDYHNGLLLGVHDKLIRPLQVVQNNAARLLTRSGRREHISPTLQRLHWLPIKQRTAFKVLTIIHKALHDEHSPQYLSTMFSVYRPARSLRSSDDPWKVSVSRSHRYYGHRSLVVCGAGLWNTLPEEMRGPISVQCFKRQLKTVLFRTAYDI